MHSFRLTPLPGVTALFAALWFGLTAVPAAAATITYNLSGSSATAASYGNGNTASVQESVGLTDSGTGSASLAGFTLNVGDTIYGQVTLGTPLTVPQRDTSSELLVSLLGTGNASNITFNETLDFYDSGVAVVPPAQWQPFDAAAGMLVLGATSSSATPAFTFDQLNFSATITGMTDGAAGSIGSATLTAAAPSLEALAFSPVNPLPLPASAWLLLWGVGGIALLGRRRNVR